MSRFDWFWNWFRPKPKPPIPPPVPVPPPAMGEIALLASHINAERQKKELFQMSSESRLMRAAQLHAEWMAKNRIMDHQGEGGKHHWTRIYDQGYKLISSAENVAWNTTAQGVFKQWMESDEGHRENMLGQYPHMGIGKSGNYWCLVVAKPQ